MMVKIFIKFKKLKLMFIISLNFNKNNFKQGKMKNLAHQNKLKNDMWEIYYHVYNLGQPG